MTAAGDNGAQTNRTYKSMAKEADSLKQIHTAYNKRKLEETLLVKSNQ